MRAHGPGSLAWSYVGRYLGTISIPTIMGYTEVPTVGRYLLHTYLPTYYVLGVLGSWLKTFWYLPLSEQQQLTQLLIFFYLVSR